MMWLMVLLLLFGAFLLVVEVVLPGIVVAAIGSLACYSSAAWIAFDRFGVRGLIIVICAIIVLSILSIIATRFLLPDKTWKKLALDNKIESRSQSAPELKVKPGDRGVALGRLAPMGTVMIDGQSYEAKTTGGLVDPQTEIEVIGFENYNVIVKPVK